MRFCFSISDRNEPLWANLVQNIKIISLSWNLVPRPIWICRIQWWCSLFFVLDWKYFFWANLVQQTKIVSLSWNLAPTVPHINSETNPPTPNYQCCLEVSETVSWHKPRSCYSSSMLQHWVGGRGLIYFCKVDHSRIFINFSRNWLGLNDLCEILSQNVRKSGK